MLQAVVPEEQAVVSWYLLCPLNDKSGYISEVPTEEIKVRNLKGLS